MTDYKVIYGFSTEELENKVNKYLSQGYKLSGGVCADNDSYLQAVYKG
jgi:hypothetical protein